MKIETKETYNREPVGGVNPSSVFDYNLRIYIPREEFEARKIKAETSVVNDRRDGHIESRKKPHFLRSKGSIKGFQGPGVLKALVS